MTSIVRVLLWVVASLVLVGVPAIPSLALDGDGGVDSNAGASGFIVSGFVEANGGAEDGVDEAGATIGHWESQPVCSWGGSATCSETLKCQDGTTMTQWLLLDSGRQLDTYYYCPDTGPSAQPTVTSSAVLRALRRIGLPASELVVQPPGGETLVNFDTNFYTEQGSFTRSVRLLGQRVDLKIWPSRYSWVFGDGASLASESAGAPYPDLQITHDYQDKGGVSPRVDTTYSAQFSVNGGPWRDVDGTVTIPGAPVRLEVRTARPVLVSYH